MKKVTLLITKRCSGCPMAKIFWRELKDEHEFDYAELDAMTEEGQKYVQDLSIMSVPTSIIEVDGKEPVLFAGIPSKQKVIEALKV